MEATPRLGKLLPKESALILAHSTPHARLVVLERPREALKAVLAPVADLLGFAGNLSRAKAVGLWEEHVRVRVILAVRIALAGEVRDVHVADVSLRRFTSP